MATYSVRYDQAHHIVLLEIKGQSEASDSGVNHLYGLIQCCNENECPCVLVDLSEYVCASSLNTVDAYEFSSHVDGYRQTSTGELIRYAVLLPTDQHSREIVEFACTVAGNRGLSCRQFEKQASAIEWLNHAGGQFSDYAKHAV